MGTAVAEGLLAAGFPAGRLTVANPHTAKLSRLADAGVAVTADNSAAASGADCVIIAVKPWILPDVARELVEQLAGKEVSVIVAGIGGERIAEMLSSASALSIAMPNTAVALRQSMTFLVTLRGTCEVASEVFAATGSVMDIEERLLPGATALASCGIAYGMRYVRAASEGGVELGFRAAEAQQIIVQTLKGVAAILGVEGSHPEAEIDKVTTPGGLTIRGLNAMERNGFTTAVIEGLKASVR